MTAEQFLWAFIKSEILYPKKLSFKPENLYYSCMEDSILAGERTGGDGTAVTRKKENVEKKNASGPVSRVLSLDDHLSRTPVARRL